MGADGNPPRRSRAIVEPRLLAVVVSAAVAACSAPPQPSLSETRMSLHDQTSFPVEPDSAYPTVRALLGDSLSVLRDASTLPIADGPRGTGENIFVTTPARLVYGPRDHALAFPPGLFLSLVPMAGHVVEIRASPHLGALPLDQALALAERVGTLANAAGWHRAQGVVASPDSVRRALTSLPPEASYKQLVDRWQAANGDEMFVSVQRTKSVADVRAANTAFGTRMSEHDQFLVDVYLTNGPVFERYAAIDRARR